MFKIIETSKLFFLLLLLNTNIVQGQSLLESRKILKNSTNEIEAIDAYFVILNHHSDLGLTDSINIDINKIKHNYNLFIEEKHIDYRIGEALQKNNNKIALRFYKTALQQAIIKNDSLYIALSKLRIASSDSLSTNYETSSKLLFESLTQLKKLSYNKELDEIYYQLGKLYLGLNNIEKAQYYYTLSDSISKLTNDKEVNAYALNGLASVYFHQDSIQKSLDYFYSTLEYFIKIEDHIQIAILENNISIALDKAGRKKESLIHTRRSLNSRIILKDSSGIASSSLNLASILYEQKRYDSSLIYLKKAIEISKKTKYSEVLMRSYQGISFVYKALDNYKDAYKYQRLFFNLKDSIYKNDRLKIIQEHEKEKDIALEKFNNKLEIQSYESKIQQNFLLILALTLLLLTTGIILFLVYRSGQAKKLFSSKIFENLKFLEQLLETVPDPIYYRDDKGIFLGCNRAFCLLVDKKKGQIIGKNREDVYGKFKIKDFAQNDTLLLESNEPIKFDKKFIDTKGNSVHLRFHSAPYLNSRNKSKGVIGLIVDITKQKEIEKQLRNANESKELFMSIISHDIRNSFNAVLAFTSLLNEDYNYYTDDKRIELISNIHEASNNTFLLLENLLGWSRAQQGGITIHKKNTDILDLLEESITLLQPASQEKNIKIINQVVSTEIIIDENSVKTIFRNLISNAIKFSNKNSEILIYSELKSDKLNIYFKDQGIGIPKNKLDILFELNKDNQQLGTNNESGSGLGLLLSTELIKLNNGKISVESQENKGSLFTVCLKTNSIED